MFGLSYHFPLIYVYYWATYLWLLTVIVFTNFSSLILLFISLICQGLSRVWQLHNNCVVIASMYSFFVWATIPPTLRILKKNLPLPSPLQQLLDWYISVHSNESQQFVVSTISFGWKLALSVGIIASTLRCCFLFNLLLFIWATIPPTLLIWKKHSIPITSAGVSRLVHFSAPQCNLTMNHLFWMTISTKFELSSLRCVEHFCLIFTGWSNKVSIVFMVKPLVF
jgi:hypothetical protein